MPASLSSVRLVGVCWGWGAWVGGWVEDGLCVSRCDYLPGFPRQPVFVYVCSLICFCFRVFVLSVNGVFFCFPSSLCFVFSVFTFTFLVLGRLFLCSSVSPPWGVLHTIFIHTRQKLFSPDELVVGTVLKDKLCDIWLWVKFRMRDAHCLRWAFVCIASFFVVRSQNASLPLVCKHIVSRLTR